MGLNDFHIKWIISTHWIKKMKILGAVLELPAKQHCRFGQFGPNGLDWHHCLAGNSKTAPRIFIFLIVLGAEYSSYVKSIETHACAFLTLNILSIGTVIWPFSQSGQSGFPPNLASNWIFGSFFPLFGSKKISLIGFLYFLVAFKSSKYLF